MNDTSYCELEPLDLRLALKTNTKHEGIDVLTVVCNHVVSSSTHFPSLFSITEDQHSATRCLRYLCLAPEKKKKLAMSR